MTIAVYAVRCIVMILVTFLGLRIVGKKSIAQITTYDLAGILLMTTVAAEPLVYKIPSKATEGVLVLALCLIFLGKLSLNKRFYNIDQSPSVVIANGKVDKAELKKNNMNIPFLLSMLRLKSYAKISDVEFAIVEPNGQLSVIPKSQQRAVKPTDLKIDTKYEGLALPLIIDGEIQYRNLEYANLDTNWLNNEIRKAGTSSIEDIFLAELDSQGQLYVGLYDNVQGNAGSVPPIF